MTDVNACQSHVDEDNRLSSLKDPFIHLVIAKHRPKLSKEEKRKLVRELEQEAQATP